MDKKNFAMSVVPNSQRGTIKRKKLESYFDIAGKQHNSKTDMITSELAIALNLTTGITSVIVQNRAKAMELLKALDNPKLFDNLFN